MDSNNGDPSSRVMDSSGYVDQVHVGHPGYDGHEIEIDQEQYQQQQQQQYDEQSQDTDQRRPQYHTTRNNNSSIVTPDARGPMSFANVPSLGKRIPKAIAKYTVCLILFIGVLIACIVILMYLSLSSDLSCGKRCSKVGDRGLYLSAFGNCQAAEKSNDTCKNYSPDVFFVAINKYQFGNYKKMERSPVCNKCMLISGPRGVVRAKVTDVCEDCGYGEIALSLDAFGFIVDDGEVDAPVSWGPC